MTDPIHTAEILTYEGIFSHESCADSSGERLGYDRCPSNSRQFSVSWTSFDCMMPRSHPE
jgi:hypothetical protein